MKSIIEALGSYNFEDIKVAITTLKNTLCDKSGVEKLDRFEENRKNNTTFKFLMNYKDMVAILFEFIHASRLRNWLAHLNALEEIIPMSPQWTESSIAECYQFIYQICEH